MKETQLWNMLKNGMGDSWNYHRHEDRFGSVPDISYAFNGSNGWIEMKAMRKFPKRTDSLVDIGLRPDQAFWMRKRLDHGGTCFLFIAVPGKEEKYKERNYFCLIEANHKVLKDVLDKPTVKDFWNLCEDYGKVWDSYAGINWKEFKQLLTWERRSSL